MVKKQVEKVNMETWTIKLFYYYADVTKTLNMGK